MNASDFRQAAARRFVFDDDLSVRLDGLEWSRRNLTAAEQARLYNDMSQFWGDFSEVEKALYLSLYRSAEKGLRQGGVGCGFCGIGCPDCGDTCGQKGVGSLTDEDRRLAREMGFDPSDLDEGIIIFTSISKQDVSTV